MRRLFLRDAAAGDIVEDVFIITGKQLAATASGKHYIKAYCSDRTAQVNCRVWNATREMFAAMPDGGFLRIRGRVENYQNNLQFIVEQMWAAREGTFDIADLMPHTDKDIDQMCSRVFEICGSVHNRHLAALLQAYLDDEELMNNFCRAPAAMNFHHAFVGGLLEHTLNAMEVGDAVCKFYPKLNRDLVIAGIFLHDLAKTWELSYENAFSYTDSGQLVGHIVKGAIWVEQKAAQAEKILGEPIPRPLIDVIQHIILSHHGEPEFGAAKVPATPEAIAVHVVENLDAKLMMALSVTRGEGVAGESNWTDWQKAFNGRLYRPDIAPSDEQQSEIEPPPTNAPTNKPPTEKPPIQKPLAEKPPAQTSGEKPFEKPRDKPMPPAAPAPGGKVASDRAPEPMVKMKINNPLFESDQARKH